MLIKQTHKKHKKIKINTQKIMRHCVRNFIIGFLLLWFPLQGFAAPGMSFCRHNHVPPPAMQATMQYHHAGHDCDHHQNTSCAKHQTQCDDCGYCHLAGAPALLHTPTGLSDNASFSFKFAFETHFPQFFPEQPQRPPHALFSRILPNFDLQCRAMGYSAHGQPHALL